MLDADRVCRLARKGAQRDPQQKDGPRAQAQVSTSTGLICKCTECRPAQRNRQGAFGLARGLNAIRNKRTGHELKRRFRRLPGLFANAPNAGQPSAIDKELSELSEWLLQNFLVNEISAKDFHAAEARLAHVGMLIQKRRRSAALHQLESFFGQWQSSA